MEMPVGIEPRPFDGTMQSAIAKMSSPADSGVPRFGQMASTERSLIGMGPSIFVCKKMRGHHRVQLNDQSVHLSYMRIIGNGNTITGNNNIVMGNGNKGMGNYNIVDGSNNHWVGDGNILRGEMCTSNGESLNEISWCMIEPFGIEEEDEEAPARWEPLLSYVEEPPALWQEEEEEEEFEVFPLERESPQMPAPAVRGLPVPPLSEQDKVAPEGASTCIICIEMSPVCAVLPCMHQCICCSCARDLAKQNITACPVCRAPMDAIKRVFSI